MHALYSTFQLKWITCCSVFLTQNFHVKCKNLKPPATLTRAKKQRFPIYQSESLASDFLLEIPFRGHHQFNLLATDGETRTVFLVLLGRYPILVLELMHQRPALFDVGVHHSRLRIQPIRWFIHNIFLASTHCTCQIYSWLLRISTQGWQEYIRSLYILSWYHFYRSHFTLHLKNPPCKMNRFIIVSITKRSI